MNIHEEIIMGSEIFKKELDFSISNQLKEKFLEIDEPAGFQTQSFVYGDVPPRLKSNEYLKSSLGWVYACVSAISDAVAEIEPELYSIDKNGEIKIINDHPILDVLSKINLFTSRYDHFWLTQQYLELTGEAPWFVDRGENGDGEPQNLILLRPDRLDLIKSKDKESVNTIESYNYRMELGEKINIKFNELIFLKYPDPVNTFRGKGTLQAAAPTVDIDSFSEEFNRRFFFNSARPDSILTTDQKLTPRQRESIKTDLNRLYRGKENAHKTAILESGLEWKPMSITQKDMDFLEQQKFTMAKILSIFRVPKSIVAISDDVNLANAKVAEYVFAKRTIAPKLKKLYSQLNEFFVPMFKNNENLFLAYSDPVPQDIEMDLKKYDSALGRGWMTINEVRKEQNLEDVGKDGDIIYLPISQIPLGSGGLSQFSLKEIKSNKVNINKKDIINRSAGGYGMAFKRMAFKNKNLEIKEKTFKKIDELDNKMKKIISNMVDKMIFGKKKNNDEIRNKKEEFGRLFIKMADIYERKFFRTTLKIFNHQKNKILDKFPKKAIIEIDDYLLDEEDETQLLLEIYTPLMKELIKDQGNKAGLLVGGEAFDEMTKRVREFIKKRTFKFSFEINEKTNELLKNTLNEGIKVGEGIPQLRKRIEDLFEGMSKYRAERIARSEVIRASNFAADEAYRQSGVVEGKEWLVTFDDKTCEFCAPLNGKKVNLGNDFFSKGDNLNGRDGGSLDLDYEDIGFPPLHSNCRCTIIPIVK